MQKALEIIEEVKKAVVGKNAVVGKMLMVILAQGHILLEDIPGVGKPPWPWPFPRRWRWTIAGCSSPRTSCPPM